VCPGQYSGLMTIRTTRLDLVPVEPSDAHAALSGERRPDWASDYPTEGDLVIARLIAQNPVLSADAYVPYKITLRASGQVIGGCGFIGPPDATGSVEIGYGLAQSHRGKGIATEAVNGLVDEAWKDPVVKLVFALTDQDNEPSQGVLRRAGFRQVDSDSEHLRWEIVRPLERLSGSDPGVIELPQGT
jgi:[ribosomal protein S5]-alanine N-acetyltransferase